MPRLPVLQCVLFCPCVRNCAARVWALVRSSTQLDVEYLPVYRPSPQEIADPDLYAHNVQQVAQCPLLVFLLVFALAAR